MRLKNEGKVSKYGPGAREGTMMYTANIYSQITFTLFYRLARNTNSICKFQVRWNVSKNYADLGQKLLRDKGSLLVLQDRLRNYGT